LSGKYELIGRKALKGTLIATGFFQSKNEGVKVIVKDSGSAPEELGRMLEDIVIKDRASTVIGPVIASYIKEISGIIKLLEVPTVVFPISAEDTSQASSYYLIGFSYSLEKQARVLATYAVEDVKISSFGILYPQTRLGELFKEAFIRAVKETGGNIVYIGSYDPKLRDISGELKWIRSRNPEAVFIPDNATESAELVTKLRAEGGLRGSIFLGPNTWNSDSFLSSVGEADRIILTDFFFPGSDRWIDFRNKYKAAFNEDPGFLEYQLYEAVSLILHVLKFPINNRTDIIERLLAMRENPLFDITQNPIGGLEISPKPLILTVRNGAIVRVK
jgi:ABC-type branched-chain amino acid transport systems, periplasmic component